MTDTDNRYKALIQPIKDIAANWDIDIAESLTEYLEELDSLRISLDGGKNNLNFAEAALLIQGSTAVYSKKVEYLHQLVLQSLEFITSKKSATNNGAQTKTNRSSVDDEDLLIFDTEASFLLLDHIVEEGQNINLKAAPPSGTMKNGRLSNSLSSTDNNTSRVSMSLMHSILSDDQGTASLKLSTSMVDGSGALLVCGALPGNSKLPMGSRSSLQNSFHEQSRIQNSSSFQIDEAPLVGDDVDFYDDGNDAGGYWDDEEPEQANGKPQVDETVRPFTVPSRPTDRSPTTHKSRKPFVPPKDMFAQLDPHSVVPGSREVRRGKTYKIPRATSTALSSSLANSQLRVDHLYADFKPTNLDILRSSGSVPLKGLFNPALLPVLIAKRKQVRKERMAQMRLRRLAAMENSTPQKEQYHNLHLIGAEGSLNMSRHEELWAQDYADYGSDAGGNDFGGDFGDDAGDDYEGHGPASEELSDHIKFPTEGEDYFQETEEEALARRVANVLNEELNDSTRTSYESICQKYIDNFNQGAHLFAKETQLSRRVAEWTQRLEPILQQQEEAAQFDIHAYCEQFLEEVNEVTAEHEAALEDESEEELPVSFGEVVAGKSSGEVCRIFLACLQLVNHGNVSITPAEGIDQWTFAIPSRETNDKRRQSTAVASDPFTVKVNAKRDGVARDRVDAENYLAPSLNDKRGGQKSAMKGSGKGKGSKRVHVDIPSNILISI